MDTEETELLVEELNLIIEELEDIIPDCDNCVEGGGIPPGPPPPGTWDTPIG
jgi:hypothetical protein